ncbi:hypothetical protein N0V85_006599 [Neurospora sp. IMI 360204]|nr:hypothetical protein N0V85_006599 [Neurospora sp. IMI 360204]
MSSYDYDKPLSNTSSPPDTPRDRIPTPLRKRSPSPPGPPTQKVADESKTEEKKSESSSNGDASKSSDKK